MPEAACAEKHEGEDEEIVGGVDQDAGGQRAGAEARPAEDQADANEQEEWAEGMGGLLGVHQGEGNAGDDGGNNHGLDGPLRMAVYIERAYGLASSLFSEPIPGRA